MIVDTYLTKPAHTYMAVLINQDKILHEDGKEYRLEDVPKDTRIWSSWDHKVEHIWKDLKIGEVLIYSEDPIRWRKQTNTKDHYWGTFSNGQDVYLLKTQHFPTNDIEALQAFMEWRDWIEEYGGKANGTVASTSWSIWRASLDQPFISPRDWPRAVKFPIGGRLVPCREPNSGWVGDFIQWDMQAAYSRKLGTIKFGGPESKWIDVKESSHYRELAAKGIPVYVTAKVWVPKMRFGPLPQRRQKYSPFSYVPIHYFTNKQLYGTWTYQEIEQAEKVGCKIGIDRIWVHSGGEFNFARWWLAIEDGRENLQGFARYLAKVTGNSLWGQFAFREKKRKIRWFGEDGKRDHRIIQPRLGSRPQSPELADQLSGQIRAELYEMMMLAEGGLMQANTDGAWVQNQDGWMPPDQWRIKNRAKYMEFIDASNYRFWEPDADEPTYIMAGVPMDWQKTLFEQTWDRVLRGEKIEDAA